MENKGRSRFGFSDPEVLVWEHNTGLQRSFNGKQWRSQRWQRPRSGRHFHTLSIVYLSEMVQLTSFCGEITSRLCNLEPLAWPEAVLY